MEKRLRVRLEAIDPSLLEGPMQKGEILAIALATGFKPKEFGESTRLVPDKYGDRDPTTKRARFVQQAGAWARRNGLSLSDMDAVPFEMLGETPIEGAKLKERIGTHLVPDENFYHDTSPAGKRRAQNAGEKFRKIQADRGANQRVF